jgi:hypothetical protein
MIQRPQAFENLIKDGTLHETDRLQEWIDRYLVVAADMLRDGKRSDNTAHGRYITAYEGVHSLASAVLLHYGTRTSNQQGHRNTAFNKLCDVVGVTVDERRAVMTAHSRRNETTYKSPLPPLSHKDAETVVSVLANMLPKVIAIVSPPASKPPTLGSVLTGSTAPAATPSSTAGPRKSK